MDDRDPDLEGLLRRTAQEPAGAPDPRDISRRARRRTVALRTAAATATLGVVAVAAVALAGLLPTRGTDVVLDGATVSPTPAPTPSTAPSPSPSPDASPTPDASPSPTGDPTPTEPDPTGSPAPRDAAPPDRWVGVRDLGDEREVLIEVVVHEGASERVVARMTGDRTVEEGHGEATDVVLDEPGGTVLVGTCCEPVSGSLRSAALDGEGGWLESASSIQGFRADLHTDGTLFARTDFYGILGIQPAFPTVEDQEVREHMSAADVGVEPGPGGRVAVLVDPELASMPVPEHADRSLRVLERTGDGTWQEDAVALADRACALVFLAGDRVGLLHASGTVERVYDQPHDGFDGGVLRCTGERLDVVDLATGEIEEGAVAFGEPVSHVNVDGGGEYVIATAASGRVLWATLDGGGGELGAGGYVAADW